MIEIDEDTDMATNQSTNQSASQSSSSTSNRPKVKAAVSLSGDLDLPWIEKYRPRVLDDVVGNQETIERLKSIAKHGNMPNIIVSGPPGIGSQLSSIESHPVI
jgi:replication factor C subunit 2/4